MTRQTTHDTATRRKSTLFCWECEHASPIDGDWIRRASDGSVTYVCPRCGTAIDERPRRTDESAWRRALRHSLTVWRAAVALPSRA